MKTYTATRNVSHDNKAYTEGDVIELEDDAAEVLLKAGAVVDPDAEDKKPSKKSKK